MLFRPNGITEPPEAAWFVNVHTVSEAIGIAVYKVNRLRLSGKWAVAPCFMCNNRNYSASRLVPLLAVLRDNVLLLITKRYDRHLVLVLRRVRDCSYIADSRTHVQP
jgi:hypothetical protein